MTRSIFDPTGGETERSGNRFTPPDADQISNMPSDVTDGVVDPDAEDDQTDVPANLGAPVPGQSASDNSMSTAESNPGVEATDEQRSSKRVNDERPSPGSAVE